MILFVDGPYNVVQQNMESRYKKNKNHSYRQICLARKRLRLRYDHNSALFQHSPFGPQSRWPVFLVYVTDIYVEFVRRVGCPLPLQRGIFYSILFFYFLYFLSYKCRICNRLHVNVLYFLDWIVSFVYVLCNPYIYFPVSDGCMQLPFDAPKWSFCIDGPCSTQQTYKRI